MRSAYLVLVLTSCISYTMDSQTENPCSKLSLAQAKKEIGHCINLEYSFPLKQLLQQFGSQLSEKVKDHYLFNCYARPSIAPLFLALGANANLHRQCGCKKAAWSGLLTDSCKYESILHLAAETGNSGVVKALLEYKAQVNAINAQNETPLMKASRIRATNFTGSSTRYIEDYIEIIEHLVAAGADATLVNRASKTALQIAHIEITNPQKRQIIVNCLTCQKIK